MTKLFRYLSDYKKECVLGPLFKLLEAGFDLIVPLVMAAIIDVGIANRDSSYILKLGGVLLLLAAIGLTCSITAQYFAAKAAVGFSAKLRHALFAHIESLSFREMDQIGTATMITRMTSDINQIQSGVNMALRLFLRSPFIVFGAMILAFTIDVKVAFVFVVVIPLLALVVFGIMLISMPLYRKVQGALDQVLDRVRQNLTGVRVIRAFHLEENEKKQFTGDNASLTKLQLFVGRIASLTNPVTYIMINVALVVLLWMGAVRIDGGYLKQGEVVALVNYMSQILVELIKLANTIVLATKAVACGRRVQTILEMSSSLTVLQESGADETGNSQGQSGSGQKTGQDNAVENGTGKAETSCGDRNFRVVFDHVTMSYQNGGDAALEGIHFAAEAGQTIGIIGGTGSGKSTLVNLIPRFYDVTEGAVRIDGQDVRSIPMGDLRNRIGIVLQKAMLFHGTIRENILWGKEDASEEEIRQALQDAQAWEIVQSKEKGLETEIEQGGRNLSGGQKQRLTIARALVRRPDILILDDSTSALDYATDAKLRQAIRSLDYHPTVFLVSQRTSSIQYADQIIVLDDGEVAGMGTHEELLQNCEVYQEIHYSQLQNQQTGKGA
ncbi:MAG: ABC transporter ATP-binding protein/permease [Lachnospiraceae bacterium]|nr:ABC transporter ATP-binding protein/permease [Lachnospiraceae bacterium]